MERNYDLLYETAIKYLDPLNTGIITEGQIIIALYQLYKEYRFASISLNDYGELHESLRTVLNVIFAFVMMIIIQGFMQINITSFLLPFITLALTLSFALGPLIGNIFLDTVYVFFMVR